MKKKRRTYWAVDQVQKVHRDRALLLNEKGYDVHFFTSPEQLINELNNKRAAIVIVSDSGSKDFVSKTLSELMGLPQIQGARMILTCERHLEETKLIASVAGFRDIIPIDLTDKQFLQRFVFATANKQLPFIQPTAQVTLNNISAISMPARITWISNTRLRIECRVKPPIGAMLNLKGDIAKSMGVHSVSLTVVENQRSHLIYRFSEAVICEWKVPKVAQSEASLMMERFKKSSPNQRCRVFIGAQSTILRNNLLEEFDDPRFEVSAALQRQSLVNEPKFFTPHVIVVESSLVSDEHASRFHEMMGNIQSSTAIIIIGGNVDLPKIKAKYPGHKIMRATKMPQRLSKIVLDKFAPVREEHHADRDAVFITSDNKHSMAEISFSARLTRIHPVAIQVSLPFPVGQFALCRIDSPILRNALGRSPYMKFTSTYQDLRPDAAPYNNLADGYLADLDTRDRKKIASTLSQIVMEQMQRFDSSLAGNFSQEDFAPLQSAQIIAPSGKVRASRSPYGKSAASSVATQNTQAVRSASSKTKTAAISASSTAIQREAVSMTEIVASESSPQIDHGKITREDFKDLLRPASGPMAEAVDDITKGIKATTSSKQFMDVLKYASIAAFLAFMFWGAFLLMAKNYEHSGKNYSNSIRGFAPNHFKRFQEKEDK